MFLETPRLIFTPPTIEQFDQVYNLFSDPEVTHFMGGPHAQEKVREELEHMIRHFKKHGFSFGDIYEKTSGQYVGQAGLVYLALDDTQPDIEVGYALHKMFWNNGYATELTWALIHWGFEHLPIRRLIAVTRPDNEKSRHVLEKAGMRYSGRIQCHEVELAKYIIYKDK